MRDGFLLLFVPREEVNREIGWINAETLHENFLNGFSGARPCLQSNCRP